MSQKHLHRIAQVCFLVSLGSGAGCASPKAPVGVGNQQAKSAALAADSADQTKAPTAAGGGAGAGIPAGAALLDATYAINATAIGMTACTGNLEVKVSGAIGSADSAQLFQIPQGVVTCPLAGQSIDLAQMLKAFTGTPPVIVAADGVIAVQSLEGATYTPPRPLLPSFISSTPEQLAHLNLTRNITIRTADGKTDQGVTSVQMVSFDQPYTVPGLGRVFQHTLDFKITNTGFANTDKVVNMLFDAIEFRISLDPIAILYIAFDGTAGQYLAAESDIGTAGGSGTNTGGALGSLPGGGDPLKAVLSGNLLGAGVDLIVKGIASIIQVHLEMNLTAEQNLDTSAGAQSTTQSLGETINGKKTGN